MESFSLEETMEEAIDNLQATVSLAQICQHKSTKQSRELFSHVKALEEDLASLSITKTNTPATVDLAKKVKKEALLLKRSLEREAFTLHQTELQQASTSSQATTSSHTAKPEQEPHKVKLHSLKIPPFSGEPSQFRLFFDIYRDNVENNTTLTETAKWVYLDESIKGAAAELISKVPRQPETRKIALKLLETRYGSLDRTICDIYQQIQTLPPASIDDNALRLTQAQLEGLLLSLEELGHQVNNNEFLKSVVKGKFPKEFLHLIVTTPQTDNLKQIRENLQIVIEARERVLSDVVHTPTQRRPYTEASSNAASRPPTQRSTRYLTPRTPRCIFCAGPHWSDECTEYATITAREKRLPDRCLRCFRLKHENDCITQKRCAHCDDTSHNRALCPKKFKKDAVLYTATSASLLQPVTDGVYLTLLITVSSTNAKSPQRIRAVLDSGGAKSIITSRAAQLLQIEKATTPDIRLSGLGKADLPTITPAAQKMYLHTNDEEKIAIDVHITPTIADDLPSANVDAFRTKYPTHRHTDIAPTGEGQAIDLLLGKDTLASICTLNKSIYVNEEHQLLSTKFGYLIVGNRLDRSPVTQHQHFYFSEPNVDDVRNFWQLDTLGLQSVEQNTSEHEEAALEQFYKTITFVDGRYQIGWPFVVFPPLLNVDYGLAVGRLRSVWNRLQHNPDLLQAYHQIIMDQLKAGIIEQVTTATQQNAQILHYIPNHPILRRDKSTKIRIVYDASAKSTKTAKSLNENLHVGGNWVKDIFAVLLRLRLHKIVITADIEKAFLQIAIRTEDRDAIRFLWLHNPAQPPEPSNLRTYRFCRMAFGVISSPFLLAATIQHHLHSHPHPFNTLIQNHLYADNLVLSLPDNIDATEFYDATKEIFKSMGMNMTQWATNSSSLQQHLPPADLNNAQIQTILGLEWHISSDTLHLRNPPQLTATDHILTKRRALRQMAAVFDPLGLATPIVLRAKIFIRKLWAEQTTWDETIINTKQQEWHHILHGLRQAKEITLSRQFFPHIPEQNITKLEIHVFADASAEAYASVLYLRCVTTTTSQVAFLAAKTRLSPKKKLTIPRLELLAILTGCRFAKFVAAELQWDLQPEIIVWSDSRCALTWIRNEKILPAIIQKQINEIHQHEIIAFKYVPSHTNYADVATRGANYTELCELKWWEGPPWLANKKDWPSPTEPAPSQEAEIHLHFHTRTPPVKIQPQQLKGIMDIDYQAVPNFTTLLIRVAHCCQALNRLLKKTFLHTTTPIDTQHAEYLLIRYEQQQAYPSMYDNIHPPTTLHNIRVFIDPHGLIRCQTRLTHAKLSPTTITPLLLIKGSRLTELIVLDAHRKVGHAGTSHTLAHVRQKFWLPQGRREVFHIIRKHCFVCRRFATKPYPPPPASPLPEFRITQTDRPFQAIGLDIFGPYQVRTNNQRPAQLVKNWVLLATCAVTRAVHLEVLTDMSTVAILDALRRFVARRGSPNIIVADNAPQFTNLDDQFRHLWRNLANQTQAVAYFTQQRIQFKFLPPSAPWMGGFYERLVGTVKKAFDKTYDNRNMLQRQFETAIIEVESIINSRPLTYLNSQPENQIITPLDFLRVKFPAIPIDHLPHDDPDRLRCLWRSSQQSLNEFWEYWSQQYLLHLRERDDQLRKKQGKNPATPVIGDIVLLVDPEKTRCAWQLGKIETLIISNDGHTRSALVNLGNNRRLVRPIIKLAPLGLRAEMTESDSPQLNDAHNAIVLDAESSTPVDTDEEDQVIEIQLDDEW